MTWALGSQSIMGVGLLYTDMAMNIRTLSPSEVLIPSNQPAQNEIAHLRS
jgi:hypothetical protein